MLFLKPTSSYLKNGGTIQIPHNEGSLHHEVELAVVIAKKARDVSESSAMDYVAGIHYSFILCLILLLTVKIVNRFFKLFFISKKLIFTDDSIKSEI